MKRTSIDKETIHVDYSQENLLASVKNFQPSVYRDGEMYHCILGTDREQGIFGSGKTIEEAMIAWDDAYQEKKRH